MKRDDLYDLAAFAVVAEQGSFTRAAAELGMSQSALSHAMKALEERLGGLSRTTRSVSTTEAGETLLRSLRPALADSASEGAGESQDVSDSSHWRRTNLLQQPQQIGLAMLFDDLPVGHTIKVHGLDLDFSSGRRNAEEGPLVRAAHGEACGYPVAFRDQLLERPLNIRKAPAHHPDDREVARRPLQRLGATRYVKYGIRRDEFLPQIRARRINEVSKSLHQKLVGFDRHTGLLRSCVV